LKDKKIDHRLIKLEDDALELETPNLIREASSYETLYDFVSEDMLEEASNQLKQS